ncbi:transposase [Pelagibaculum spongiae]|uniref:Transposase n=1 Tax=Pelagibaculum spongiae TaxID=2080658 RepID=A0A2V1GVE6_9GAMM|nr:transposase [Pelagibaculum spongiae]PVZ64319.1 transposase [Pelagibaculum spongiae]
MPSPRAILYDPKENPFLHVISRCVRRGWLCGEDPTLLKKHRKNYDHRRQWIVDRIDRLSQAFAVDIAAYAVMSNHYHLVVYIDVERAKNWNIKQVLLQYCKVFSPHPWVKDYLDPSKYHLLTQMQVQWVEETADTIYRERLYSISWFMRSINEPLARMANAEDQCKGRFWEGRFKAQALLDQQALLTCMAYVDLNPLRAGIAQTPEDSNYTSVQARVETELPASNHRRKKSRKTNGQRRYDYNFARLKSFVDSESKPSINIKDKPQSLPFKLKDYLELVDASARMVRTDKKYHIDSSLPTIFERLKIETDARWWASAMSGRSTVMASARQFAHAMGNALNLKQFRDRVKQQTEAWRQQMQVPGKQPPS